MIKIARNIVQKAVDGISQLLRKSKKALGTAIVVSGGIFTVSMLIRVFPDNIGIVWGLIIGIGITILGGYLVSTG